MSKSIVGIVIGIVLIVGIGAGLYFHMENIGEGNKIPNSFSNSLNPPITTSTPTNATPPVATDSPKDPLNVKEVHTEFAINFENPRVLVGASHNVFVGKVIRQIGTRPGSLLPVITRFEVEPIHNIKGNLQETIIVEQSGGYQNGILYVLYGGDLIRKTQSDAGYMLQPGSAYLFATRYEGEAYFLQIYPTAKVLISNDSRLSDDQLTALSRENLAVVEFSTAYPNEILDKYDVRDNNARNSYQSVYPGSTPESNPPSSSSTSP